MNNKYCIVIGMSMGLGVTFSAVAQPVSCAEGETLAPVSGKVFNNAVQPGMTLGTVHAKIGTAKMKCGILGQGASGNDGSINYMHTFVCDDEVVFPPTGDTMHSQLTLNTTGVSNFQACGTNYPPGSAYGTFQEISVPVPGTGRGIFSGVQTGEVRIDGTINCLGTIDMKFTGAVCLKTAP